MRHLETRSNEHTATIFLYKIILNTILYLPRSDNNTYTTHLTAYTFDRIWQLPYISYSIQNCGHKIDSPNIYPRDTTTIVEETSIVYVDWLF